MMIRNAATAAAAFACLMAAAAHAETREPVSARVSYAGLDLTSVEGRRILDTRIGRAVRAACQSQVAGLRGMADASRCRAEMRRDAQVRIAAIEPRNAAVVVASAR